MRDEESGDCIYARLEVRLHCHPPMNFSLLRSGHLATSRYVIKNLFISYSFSCSPATKPATCFPTWNVLPGNVLYTTYIGFADPDRMVCT